MHILSFLYSQTFIITWEVWSVENSEEKSPTKYSIVRMYQWIPTPLLPAGNFNQRKHGGQTSSDRRCSIS